MPVRCCRCDMHAVTCALHFIAVCREGSPGSRSTRRVLATGDVFIADSPMGNTLTADEETTMVSGYRSGIRHAGWLHKLVGKTPLDVRWKKYWVSMCLACAARCAAAYAAGSWLTAQPFRGCWHS